MSVAVCQAGGDRSSVASEDLFEQAAGAPAAPSRTQSGGMFRMADDVQFHQNRCCGAQLLAFRVRLPAFSCLPVFLAAALTVTARLVAVGRCFHCSTRTQRLLACCGPGQERSKYGPEGACWLPRGEQRYGLCTAIGKLVSHVAHSLAFTPTRCLYGARGSEPMGGAGWDERALGEAASQISAETRRGCHPRGVIPSHLCNVSSPLP